MPLSITYFITSRIRHFKCQVSFVFLNSVFNTKIAKNERLKFLYYIELQSLISWLHQLIGSIFFCSNLVSFGWVPKMHDQNWDPHFCRYLVSYVQPFIKILFFIFEFSALNIQTKHLSVWLLRNLSTAILDLQAMCRETFHFTGKSKLRRQLLARISSFFKILLHYAVARICRENLILMKIRLTYKNRVPNQFSPIFVEKEDRKILFYYILFIFLLIGH